MQTPDASVKEVNAAEKAVVTIDSTSSSETNSIDKFLKLLWTFDTNDDKILPLVNKNIVFLSDGKIIDGFTGKTLDSRNLTLTDTVIVYDSEAHLKVLNLKNGRLLVEMRLLRNFFIENERPELLKDKIYVTLFEKNIIKAIDALDGRILWEYQSQSEIYNKPLVFNNSVFVINKHEIIELNKFSGTFVRKIVTNNYVNSGLFIENNLMSVFIDKKGLQVFDLTNNQIVWEKTFKNSANYAYDMESDSNFNYFSNFDLYAINKMSGAEKWHLDKTHNVSIIRNDVLALVKNFLFFYTYSGGGNRLTVADKNNGKILYEGLNSYIIPTIKETYPEPKGEDLLFLEFATESVGNKIIVGKMGAKIYGFEMLK